MITQQELVLTMIRGVIAGLPAEQQAKVAECAEKVRALVKEYGVEGKCAYRLVGAELSAEE